MNLQTLVMLAGIGGVLITWGYTFSGLQRATDANTANVAALTLRLEQNDSKTDQLETRLVAVEKIAADAIILRRELEETLSRFQSDIAVIKEILMRLENGKKGSAPP